MMTGNVLLCACRRLPAIMTSTSRPLMTSPCLSKNNDELVDHYDHNKDFEAPSPFKIIRQKYHGYETKIHVGGLLPRYDGPDVEPITSDYKPKDRWTEKRALFGQNDYIDILGDNDEIYPRHLFKGPLWLQGVVRPNELQRITRQMRRNWLDLKEYRPEKTNQIRKRINYLYKQYNWYRRDKH